LTIWDKEMKLSIIKFLILTSVMLAALKASAFGSFEPRTMAMSGANLVRSRGLEGALLNPANLGLENNGSFNLKLFSVGATAGNNSLTLQDYNHISGDFLNNHEKKTLLGAIPSSGFRASTELDLLLLGISTGRMALTVDLRSAESLHLPKDLFDLALFGNTLDRTYDLGGDDLGDAWTVAATTLSYGKKINTGIVKNFSLGVGIKHLMGINYGKMGGEIDLTTSESGFTNKGYVEILSAGETAFDTRKLSMNGSGFAFDLGLACQVDRHWSFGISLMNLNNGITWKKDTKKRTLDMALDGMSLLNESGMLSGNEIIEQTDSLGMICRSRYPATFAAGLAYETQYLSTEIDVKKGFYNGAGSGTRWQIMQGIELRLLSILPIRAGVGILDNRTLVFSSGCGIKLGFINLDAAASSLGLPGYGIRGFGMSLSTGMEFGK